ncbi:MAG: ArnT family glycosyltransferase [Gemmatimonadota bacterium]
MTKSVSTPVLLCLLCVCWILPGLVGHDLWKADEPYSFGVVYTILRTGDWVVPAVAGEPFMEKPPLYYLTAALSARAFSPLLPLHDGARMASGFYMLLAFLFAYLAGKRLAGPGGGAATVALLLGSVGLLLNTHQMITDTALFAGCSIAIFGLSIADGRPVAGGAWLGVGAGIGFLSKGLLAPGIFGLASILLPAVSPPWRNRRYALCLGVALLAALPLLTIWPAALYMRSPGLFEKWLWENNFGRFFGFAHLGPPKTGTYAVLLLYFAFPAYLLALWAIWKKARGGRAERESLAVPLTVFLVMLAVFELASDARDLYALPLLLPVSMLGASVVDAFPRRPAAILHGLAATIFPAVILTLWAGWIALMTGRPAVLADWLHRTHPAYAPSFRSLAFAVAVTLTVSCILLVPRGLRKPTGGGAVLSWAAGVSLAWGVAMAVLLPWLDAGNSYRSTLSSLGRAIPPGTREIAGISIGESHRALLDYYAGVDVRPFDPGDPSRYDFLVVRDRPGDGERVEDGWRKIWEGARPGDTKEVFRLYARTRDRDDGSPGIASADKPRPKASGGPRRVSARQRTTPIARPTPGPSPAGVAAGLRERMPRTPPRRAACSPGSRPSAPVRG